MDTEDNALENRIGWLRSLGTPPLRTLEVPERPGQEPLTQGDFKATLDARLPRPVLDSTLDGPRDLPLANFVFLDLQSRIEQHVQDRMQTCNGLVLNWLQVHRLLDEEWVRYVFPPILLWNHQAGWEPHQSTFPRPTLLEAYRTWTQEWLFMLRRLQQMSETTLWDTVDFREACHLMLAAWEVIGEPLLPGQDPMEMPVLGPIDWSGHPGATIH